MEVEIATLAVTAETMSQSPETTFQAAPREPSPHRATTKKDIGTTVDIPRPVK